MTISYLYFYTNRDILTILREGKLPFKLVEYLRDPFARSEQFYKNTKNTKNARAITDEEFFAEVKRQYHALPDELAGLVTFDYFLEQAGGKRRQIEKALQQAREPEPDILQKKQRQSLTVLSLFERPDNIVLWERMAGGHEGALLVLEVAQTGFLAPHHKDCPQMLKPVDYRSTRPVKTAESAPFQALFQRSKLFADEREWRIVRPTKTADKIQGQGTGTIYWHKISPKAIKAVVFGQQMPSARREAVKKFIQLDQRYRNLSVKHCQLDAHSYSLHLLDVTLRPPSK